MDADLESFCNMLAEAERAGGKVLHELSGVARSDDLKETLRKIEHDEGYWAGEMTAYVRGSVGTPAAATGDFVEKVRSVADVNEKTGLLNKCQRSVYRKI